MTSIDKDFGLRRIPFKSLGTDTGQYPFVPGSAFRELTSAINAIRATKEVYAIVIQGPQGSGKTATKNGIKTEFQGQNDVAILHVTLSSIELSDLVFSIIEGAKEQKLIDDVFLQKIGYSPTELKNYTNPDLIKKIVDTIAEILVKNDFGILIIDEMDIIAKPAYVADPNTSQFVHRIKNIIDKIAESQSVQKKSFCIILAQTDKSAQDFKDILEGHHDAFADRLKHTQDISYDLDITKEIILSRLEAEAVPGFDKKGKGEFFPLDEEIIKYLFDEIKALRQSDGLTAFRTVEQILHDSITESLDRDESRVTIETVREKLELERKNIAKVKPGEELRINQKTKTALEETIADPSQKAGNNLYLKSIQIGMKIWEDQLYNDVDSNGSSAIFIPDNEYKLYINKIKIDTESKSGSKASHHYKRIMWYTVAKEANAPFNEEDFKKINDILNSEEETVDRCGCQFSILTIFTQELSDKERANKTITGVDMIFPRNMPFKRNIVGISLADAETVEESNPADEREAFREHWRQNITSISVDNLGENLHDIDTQFTEKQKVIAQILCVKSVIGDEFSKKKDLAEFTSTYTNLNIKENAVAPVIKSGFADEDLHVTIPRNLKSLKKLIDLGKSLDDVKPNFANKNNEVKKRKNLAEDPANYTIDAAIMLKIIDESGNLINVDNRKKEIGEKIEEAQVEEKISDENGNIITDEDKFSIQQKICKLVMDSFNKIDDVTDDLKKLIVLGFIEECIENLSKGPTPPLPPIFKCDICEQEFPDKELLNKHKLEEHKINPPPPPPPEPEDPITEESVLEFYNTCMTEPPYKLTKDELMKKFQDNPKFGSDPVQQQKWWFVITKLQARNKIFFA